MAAGAVDRFRSLPNARSAVLIGRTAADLATNAVTDDRARRRARPPALGTLAWLSGLLLIFVPLSVRAFQRA